ncbi:MAG: hypothetical protein ABR863_04340 [Roseiarcus sp.]|jgi:hypothetical protein
MASSVPDISAIRAAKDKLLATAAHYEELAAKARAEVADYETAERVWLKISAGQGNGSAAAPESDDATESDATGKPPGIPTVPAMITEALTIAHKNHLPGLEPSGVVEHIRANYWPDVKGPDVASTMWRMWKAGRLAKPDENSPIYRLP